MDNKQINERMNKIIDNNFRKWLEEKEIEYDKNYLIITLNVLNEWKTSPIF